MYIIAAMDKNRVIGRRGSDMPWGRGLKDDLKRFQGLTAGATIAGGRRTYTDDLKRALPNRRNIILTRDRNFSMPGCEIAHGMEELLGMIEKDEDLFIIGGAEIYTLALPRAKRLFLTIVEGSFEGDVLFPEFSDKEWKRIGQESVLADSRNTHSFIWEQWIRK